MTPPLFSLDGVHRDYSVREGFFARSKKTIRALDGINLDLEPNEILGLVGESGCGKSTLARITLGLEPPSSGRVYFKGKDVWQLEKDEKKRFRQNAQMIFQDPYSSLNPRMTIYQILSEPLKIHGLCPDGNYRERVQELLSDAGLSSPDIMDRFPHEFSGGQRQRIGLARALATDPELIIADEPTSALDVSIQAQIINLLLDLQEQKGLSFLFISHDLPIIQFVSHRVAVMYRGQLMELMPGGDFLSDDGEGASALHPYTRYLLSAVPVPDPERRSSSRPGDQRSGSRQKSQSSSPEDLRGCAFAPRCDRTVKECLSTRPEWRQVGKGHFLACHAV